MNVERMDLAKSHLGAFAHDEPSEGVPTPREVLEELFQLLEDYAPAWYTEEHHDRAVAALLGRHV
jgi:prephenate dehydrogenase